MGKTLRKLAAAVTPRARRAPLERASPETAMAPALECYGNKWGPPRAANVTDQAARAAAASHEEHDDANP